MGIPVVATDLPEIRRRNAEQGDVVAVARDAEDFARTSQADIERRIEVAKQNSCEERVV